MNHVRVGVAAILQRNDRILMGCRKGAHGAGTWSFPGGHLELNESVKEAGSREVLEETGLVIDPKRLIKRTFTNDIFVNEEKHYITLYVTAVVGFDDGEAQLMEPNKCIEWRWVSELPSPLFLPVQNLIKDGFDVFHRDWLKALVRQQDYL